MKLKKIEIDVLQIDLQSIVCNQIKNHMMDGISANGSITLNMAANISSRLRLGLRDLIREKIHDVIKNEIKKD